MEFIRTENFSEVTDTQPSVPTFKPPGTIFSVFLGLKAAQFFIYLFSWIFLPWTIFQWVLTIISSAVDFWFTKNVAGRLILGMRWSNRVNQDGESKWVFEFVSEMPDTGSRRRTFWMALYGCVALWGLFAFFSFVRLNFGWFFVTVIGLALACSNAWGFMQCDKSIKGDTSRMLANRILPLFTGAAQNYVFGAQQMQP